MRLLCCSGSSEPSSLSRLYCRKSYQLAEVVVKDLSKHLPLPFRSLPRYRDTLESCGMLEFVNYGQATGIAGEITLTGMLN